MGLLEGKICVITGGAGSLGLASARVLQHEQDHLEGRTVFDHAGPAKRDLIKRQMTKA